MEIVGGLSGAALGFIGGNLRGARLGYQYGKSAGKKFSKMAPVSKKRKAEATVSKAKKMKTGKLVAALKKELKKPKRAPLKRKLKAKVKVSRAAAKKIGSIVQKTLDKNTTINTYRKNYTMDQKVHFDRPDIDFYLIGGRRSDSNSGAYTEKALSFTPLSVERIVDAASVLWNGKAATINSAFEIGNLAYDKTTLHVVYASAKYKLINHSAVPLDVEVIEVTNKDTREARSFFQTAAEQLSSNNIVAVNNNSPTLFINTASDNSFATSRGLEFTDLSALSDFYSWKVVKRRHLQHGASISFGYKISDRKIDVSEFSHGTGGTLLADYCRGDRQIIIKVTPRLHGMFRTTGGTFPFTSTYETNNWWTVGLAMSCKEVYKIAQPGNVTDANEGSKTVIFSDEPIRATIGLPDMGVTVCNQPKETAFSTPSADI